MRLVRKSRKFRWFSRGNFWDCWSPSCPKSGFKFCRFSKIALQSQPWTPKPATKGLSKRSGFAQNYKFRRRPRAYHHNKIDCAWLAWEMVLNGSPAVDLESVSYSKFDKTWHLYAQNPQPSPQTWKSWGTSMERTRLRVGHVSRPKVKWCMVVLLASEK